jgi:hypothetical protein
MEYHTDGFNVDRLGRRRKGCKKCSTLNRTYRARCKLAAPQPVLVSKNSTSQPRWLSDHELELLIGPDFKAPDKPPEYHFTVYVREGAPGYADDESYTSPPYSTFEECYFRCIKFSPESHWSNHRFTQGVYMTRDSGRAVEVRSTAQECGLIEVDDLVHLGVVESQFDHVIWALQTCADRV